MAFTNRELTENVDVFSNGAFSSGRVHAIAVVSLDAERIRVGEGDATART